MSRSRNWCFTDFELQDWIGICSSQPEIFRYVNYGVEVCPDTGRNHYQGWVQFHNCLSMKSAKAKLGHKGFIAVCKGSEVDNDKYCSKDGKSYQWGDHVKQGQRSDLKKVAESILEGTTLEEIMTTDPVTYCKYRNGLKDIASVAAKNNTKEFRNVSTTVLYGPTGTGKTRTAMEEATYKISAGDIGSWWDGYNGEKTILIDEYDSDVNITKMLNILDGYQLRLPVKGGFTYANWTKVFITSNVNPDEWHLHAKQVHREALFRRISNSIYLGGGLESEVAQC